MQLSGGSLDVRERIARHLDQALFDSVIAAEVRALASCGSFERLFDSLSQFLSQVMSYRWMALTTVGPDQLALDYHPRIAATAEAEARASLGVSQTLPVFRVADEDANADETGPPPILRSIPFGAGQLGMLALSPCAMGEADISGLVSLVASELGGPLRMAALMDEAQRLATVDPLTGLMNRRALLAALKIDVAVAVRYGTPVSLLLFDVDHFKAINDTHGHGTGDLVLSTIGNVLRSELRVPDVPVRWGGEEFVVILKNTNLSGAAVAAERLRGALERLEMAAPGTHFKVTASFGAAQFTAGLSLEVLAGTGRPGRSRDVPCQSGWSKPRGPRRSRACRSHRRRGVAGYLPERL